MPCLLNPVESCIDVAERLNYLFRFYVQYNMKTLETETVNQSLKRPFTSHSTSVVCVYTPAAMPRRIHSERISMDLAYLASSSEESSSGI